MAKVLERYTIFSEEGGVLEELSREENTLQGEIMNVYSATIPETLRRVKSFQFYLIKILGT